MAVHSWPGASALDRAKALHPAAALSSPADPMPPAAAGEDTEHLDDITNLGPAERAVTRRLWLVVGETKG